VYRCFIYVIEPKLPSPLLTPSYPTPQSDTLLKKPLIKSLPHILDSNLTFSCLQRGNDARMSGPTFHHHGFDFTHHGRPYASSATVFPALSPLSIRVPFGRYPWSLPSQLLRRIYYAYLTARSINDISVSFQTLYVRGTLILLDEENSSTSLRTSVLSSLKNPPRSHQPQSQPQRSSLTCKAHN
jgi:hypothetical protein